jgi:hypothetical protein
MTYLALDGGDGQAVPWWFLAGLMAIYFLIFAIPLYFLGRRHKWALYTVVSLSLAGVILSYFIPPTSYVGWNMWVPHIAYSLLEVIGLALLATKESRAWFFGESPTQGAF